MVFGVLLRSNFSVIRGLRRCLDFRAVSGYWDSRSGSGMTVVMWSGMIVIVWSRMAAVMWSGMTIVMWLEKTGVVWSGVMVLIV